VDATSRSLPKLPYYVLQRLGIANCDSIMVLNGSPALHVICIVSLLGLQLKTAQVYNAKYSAISLPALSSLE
jgi:hypothetical protein